MKYSINSSGFIVAERDIYSLGGFIPKGSVGAKVANEDQISQDGECWVISGDLSARPDVRVKDNACIGEWIASSTAVHTDGITEFSGNTVIPGRLVVRCPSTDPKNNFFAKDSFIGVSMDVLCGPVATTTAFPFEQGGFNKDVPAGTLFTSASMRTGDANICRTTANLCLGKDTYLYIPTGYSCRVFWGYRNTAGQLAYSGESFAASQALTKLEHLTYKMAMIHITRVNGTAMTPTDLLATGAKILGHISCSLIQDFRPESASGSYVMDNSAFIISSSNFGLATTRLWYVAGGLYNTSAYTLDNRAENKIYGTFHNVQRLEYDRYLSDSYRTNVNRDKFISAYDCPLLRVDNSTYDAFAAKGDLVLRRCIVPKAMFPDNIHNGNVYEDIDFSYTSDHLGAKAGNNYDMWSSHKQGEYAAIRGGTAIAGLISRPENLAAGSILGPGIDSIPLNGSIMEQGAYAAGANIGGPYEEAKGTSNAIVRSHKPVSTASLSLPTLPSGYVLDAIVYLDESFIIRKAVANPASIETTYPYAVMQFRRADTSRLNVSDFIALGLSLSMINYGKVPEITGSSYVGAGCTVRGDVQLIGDPYVNRVLDVNLWERGENTMVPQQTWGAGKNLTNQERHFESKEAVPVETGATVSAASGYFIYAGWMDENKRIISTSGMWAASFTVPANAKYVGLVLKKASSAAATGSFIEDSDIPLANVKYLRAFKKRRYIVNELDRTSPEDTLICPDKWGQSYLGRTAGKKYSELRYASTDGISLNTPINVPASATINTGSGYARSGANLDALLVCLTDTLAPPENVALQGFALRKDPAAAILPSDVPASRFVMEFTPSPRIVVPYGVSNVWIDGTKVRMYDNSVISRTITKGAGVILKGDAVMGSVFTGDICMCSNGHSDAIINKQ
ncbi:hypothetical protein BT528P2_00015 [Bacteroides phage BT528P2]|nr:hypothetical protein BT528P2_00015 [Bacteroides phage BT528P2]